MLQGHAACNIVLLLQADCVPCKPLRLDVHQPFNGKRHDMAQRDMRFLNVHRYLAGNGEQHIGMFRQLAAAFITASLQSAAVCSFTSAEVARRAWTSEGLKPDMIVHTSCGNMLLA